MLADDLVLAVCLRAGDVPKARDMIRDGRTGGMAPAEMLRHAAEGDRPGVARMLAGEDAIDVERVDAAAAAALLETCCNVAPELLACGLRPPTPRTPLERALAAALDDTRASLAAAGIMMRAADERPDAYRRLLEVADLAPSGAELLQQAVRTCGQAPDPETGGTASTPATPPPL